MHEMSDADDLTQWNRVSDGVPSAYMGTCASIAPNFFMMMGPNSISGHLSVVYTSECQINFTLRVIEPIMAALARQQQSLNPPQRWRWATLLSWVWGGGGGGRRAEVDIVMVKPEAERRDLETVQRKANALVWATGCTSWAMDGATGRNFAMYPDWQFWFWWRSWWVRWSEFELLRSVGTEAVGRVKSA